MSDKGDCRTAPATPGLLNTAIFLKYMVQNVCYICYFISTTCFPIVENKLQMSLNNNFREFDIPDNVIKYWITAWEASATEYILHDKQ